MGTSAKQLLPLLLNSSSIPPAAGQFDPLKKSGEIFAVRKKKDFCRRMPTWET